MKATDTVTVTTILSVDPGAAFRLFTDDVDAHYRTARDAGAIVIAEPEDQFHGARSYRALDPEGHRFIFATQMREAPE